LDADQVRVMSFVPQEGAPLSRHRRAEPLRELVTIAVLRLVFPDRLIPASLDVDGLSGLKHRLDAGANVITSLIPPGNGLVGVANCSLDIEVARRTVSGVMPVVERCGLEPATLHEYEDWLAFRHKRKHSGSENESLKILVTGG
jgi:methylornithine synthase